MADTIDELSNKYYDKQEAVDKAIELISKEFLCYAMKVMNIYKAKRQ